MDVVSIFSAMVIYSYFIEFCSPCCDAMGPEFQKYGLVLENHALRHYRVRVRLSNSEYGDSILQQTKVPGLQEFRPFKLHISRLEVIGFRERVKETLNELNSKI
jgi:hypothetical protein